MKPCRFKLLAQWEKDWLVQMSEVRRDWPIPTGYQRYDQQAIRNRAHMIFRLYIRGEYHPSTLARFNLSRQMCDTICHRVLMDIELMSNHWVPPRY